MRVAWSGCLLGACIGAAGAMQRAPAARIVVGPNVLVSGAHRGDTHFEVLACAHPTDASRLIVGSVIYAANSSRAGTVIYGSRDGGRSWTPTLDGAALENSGDPACAYDAGGGAYYAASLLPPAGERTMLLYRSTDGGMHWDASSSLTYSDREYVTVDATRGRFAGRVYVNGNNRVPRGVSDFVVFSSTDSGRTFRGPAKRAAFGTVQAPVMGNAVVASDGRLIGVFAAQRRGSSQVTLDAITSLDGGETLGAGVTISEFVPGGSRKGTDNNANDQPILAIDPNSAAYRDRLYVVWPDRRAGHSQVFFSFSADLGNTWSTARAINDNPPGDSTDQFMPTVAVNRAGVVGVLWYDRRAHPDNLGWDARFTASVDGGSSFLPSVKVSERGTTFDAVNRWSTLQSTVVPGNEGLSLRVGLNNFTFLGGDTAGLVADATGVFHPVWVDNRTGLPQVWTAAVTVNADQRQTAPGRDVRSPMPRASRTGPAIPSDASGTTASRSSAATPGVRSGAPVATFGTDVSRRVTLDVTRTAFDGLRSVLTLTVRIRSAAQETLTGPFRLRVAGLQSELGEPAVAGADNGMSGAGAEWRFDDTALAANAASAARTLRFPVANLRPFRDGHRYRLGLLDLTVQVLAGTQP